MRDGNSIEQPLTLLLAKGPVQDIIIVFSNLAVSLFAVSSNWIIVCRFKSIDVEYAKVYFI